MANVDVKMELVYLLTCEQLHVLLYMKALKKMGNKMYDVSFSIPKAKEYLRMSSDKIRKCLAALESLNVIEKRFEAITKLRMPAVYKLTDYAAGNMWHQWGEENKRPNESVLTAIKRWSKEKNYRRVSSKICKTL